MSERVPNLDEALLVISNLSPLDKIRLMERVATMLEGDLTKVDNRPFETFQGMLSHLGYGPSDEDIEEVRRQMLHNFPREDFDL